MFLVSRFAKLFILLLDKIVRVQIIRVCTLVELLEPRVEFDGGVSVKMGSATLFYATPLFVLLLGTASYLVRIFEYFSIQTYLLAFGLVFCEDPMGGAFVSVVHV